MSDFVLNALSAFFAFIAVLCMVAAVSFWRIFRKKQ